LALQGPKNIFSRSLSSFFHETYLACSSSVYRSGRLVGVARKILSIGTKFYQTSMVGALGVVPVAPVASTTEVEEDVDGGAPGGCCQ
jgi:hypothetical protein